MSARLGFENAPVTLGIIEVVGGLTLFLLLFPISELLQFPSIVSSFALWRPLTNLLFFTSFVDGFLGLLLLYKFREIERMLGSAKFTAFLLFTCTTTLLLEIATMTFFEFTNPSGPYPLIYSLATLFALIVPWTDRFSLFGLHFSNKIYTYLLCFQLLYLHQLGGFVVCICSVISSLLYHYDLLISKKRIIVPKKLQRLGIALAPSLGINLQQRVRGPRQIVANAPQRNQNVPQQPFPQGQIPPIAPPSEENIQAVCGMGFSRQQAVFALQMSRNNVQLATNLLLGGQ